MNHERDVQAESVVGHHRPVRVQRKRAKGSRMPPNTVSVTRPGPFGNPFPISKGTSSHMGKTTDIWSVGTWEGPAMWFKNTKAEAAELSVAAFRKWIEHPSQAKLLAKVKKLRGKNLACFCSLNEPCHADVLLELANGTTMTAPPPAPSDGLS